VTANRIVATTPVIRVHSANVDRTLVIRSDADQTAVVAAAGRLSFLGVGKLGRLSGLTQT